MRNRGGTNRLPGQRNEGGVTYSGGVIRHSGRTEHLRAEMTRKKLGGVAASCSGQRRQRYKSRAAKI